MEWFWKELGIEPTKQVILIKKAYIEKMRDYKKLETTETITQEHYDQLEKAQSLAIAYADGERSDSLVKQETSPVVESVRVERDSQLEVVETKVELSEEKARGMKELADTISLVSDSKSASNRSLDTKDKAQQLDQKSSLLKNTSSQSSSVEKDNQWKNSLGKNNSTNNRMEKKDHGNYKLSRFFITFLFLVYIIFRIYRMFF